MKITKTSKNQKGFTLLEMIAVLVIFGILAAAAVQRYVDLEEYAYRQVIDSAISELNARESRIWAELAVSSSGWISDSDIWLQMTLSGNTSRWLNNPDLGEDYKWVENKANRIGESYLSYKQGISVKLIRTPSTAKKPARWQKN
jgi:prepilin-type N-terminal cleavage/methylation domain-containing protein